MPVLEDQGLAIVDSTVINEYLEDAYPEPPLMPASASDRARCRMWEDMADHFMAVHVTTLIREVFMKPDDDERNKQAVAGTYAEFSGYLGALERCLNGQDYLCRVYSLADIATCMCVTFGQSLGVDISKQAAVQAWYGRVSARPAVAAELEQLMSAAAAV